MLGRIVNTVVLKPYGKVENGYVYPLNYASICNESNKFAYIIGVVHPIKKFTGRIIAALETREKGKKPKTVWIVAPQGTRYINQDIKKYFDLDNTFANYKLTCLYEHSAGAIVYRIIGGKCRFLLIKNKRSANWGFPKGHIEKDEDDLDAAYREVLEETGLHIKIKPGFAGESGYTMRNKVEKTVTIFLATTSDTHTKIQPEEIDDYVWLTYDEALERLNFNNDKNLLKNAHTYMIKNNIISRNS